MNLLLDSIARHVDLTKDEQQHFLQLTEEGSFKTKTVLLEEGQVCRNSTFVNSGVLRSYTVDDNAVEHVLNFACSGWWIADMYSLISQKPGQLFIDVVEDAEVVLLSKENQEQLYNDIPKIERFFRILTENALVANQQRIIDNLSLPAEERFDKFCKRYPTLLQHVPQKQIASYIGVTPEFFSKMKSAMLKKS
ncbi:MAG TPA: Crp/Fnr family transcriptional regulator [Flavobacterium sp.]|jgi:CRP-like cAMP-binding protein